MKDHAGFLPSYTPHEMTESPSPSPASQHARSSSLSMDDPTVQKSLFDMFNKRGYNLISPSNSMVNGNNDSFSSTASSSMSSVIGFREPLHGQTPIHIAIRRGDVHVVEALLKSGDADVLQMRDDHGNTPLHFAVGTSSRRMSVSIATRMVALLLDAGASVHAVNHKGLSPIMVHLLTVRKDDPSILAMLLKHGSNANACVDRVPLLHLAVAAKLPMFTATLIRHGAHLHATNDLGQFLREVAPMNMLVTMLAHLTSAPSFLPLDAHSQCMDCRRHIKPAKRQNLPILFRWFFFRSTSTQATHCFHCGWIYCSSCTTVQPVRDGLPSSCRRSEAEEEEDRLSRPLNKRLPLSRRPPVDMKKDVSIRVCRICANLLKERLVKAASAGARASLYRFQQQQLPSASTASASASASLHHTPR
ncbi:hypothetical protein DYB38_009645 [Aphanomyces astaci]|uniref:Uncharacterized protein n=1 Tax=Aphanomyces astaci TaxID=112090 RepID=A0A397C2S1_APHAT|nr:hypothetical protein DYB38_009645 [Aphanomyces astaci]RHY74492.1 hypothetical protein DYB34_013707 [Aphanomyces astaci]